MRLFSSRSARVWKSGAPGRDRDTVLVACERVLCGAFVCLSLGSQMCVDVFCRANRVLLISAVHPRE